MKRAAVVTVGGSKRESLGALKLAAWLRRAGWEVEERTEIGPLFDRFDLYAFSCVFSWHLPRLVEMANTARNVHGGEVWIGGPAVTFSTRNAEYVERETGIVPHHGLITIEIANSTPLPARIHSGEGIGQILFLEGSAPCRYPYNAKPGASYQDQSGLTMPRA